MTQPNYVRWFENLSNEDVGQVGGKNASLGEMIQSLQEEGVRVPGGFSTTADAYRLFLEQNELEAAIRDELQQLSQGSQTLRESGKRIRRQIRQAQFPNEVAQEIREAYAELGRREAEARSGEQKSQEIAVAVRSSATAEDLPEASFAGQQETFLNVQGADDLLDACRKCYASLFTDRAIAYREEQDFDHLEVALTVGIQKMVRADQSGSGVMFSIDTETGFPDVVVINAAWGLGETVVQGSVNPDEYRVFKPLLAQPDRRPLISRERGSKERKMIYASGGSETTKTVETRRREQTQFVLTEDEVLQLARWAVAIEKHYGQAMDMEWAKDGETDQLYIVQARPETVQSQRAEGGFKHYVLQESGRSLTSGIAIGQAIATGRVHRLDAPVDADQFPADAVLVTEMTDPDWVPLMRKAAAIVTDQGGRTSHAAIVSRELGVPAVVGTSDGSEQLSDEQQVTVCCAEGDVGQVYEGELEFAVDEVDVEGLPESPVKLQMNIASPSSAFQWWRLPTQGIGLARMEFIINRAIKVHPLALTRFDQLDDDEVRQQIEALTEGYDDRCEYFVEQLARGLAAIAASQHPHEVVVRMSDFKSNEYAELLGGEGFEPHEENPMLGFRGASRYYSDDYRDGFALECQAVKRAREVLGFDNIAIMIPFVRTVDEADRVLETLREHGLKQGENGLRVKMMCEVPANVLLAQEFAKRFDGFSIGSNDLTQLLLGVDRDSGKLSHLFDERNDAVQQAIAQVIAEAHEVDCEVGICGQAPSDYPDFARFLVDAGIDAISLNPDSVLTTLRHLDSDSPTNKSDHSGSRPAAFSHSDA